MKLGFYDLPPKLQAALRKYGIGPSAYMPKGGWRLRVPNRVLLAEYDLLTRNGFGRKAAFRNLAAKHDKHVSTIKRHIKAAERSASERS